MKNEKTGKVISDNIYEISKDMKRDRLKLIFQNMKGVSIMLTFIFAGLSITWLFGMLLKYLFGLNIYLLLSGLFLSIIMIILFSHLERWRGRVEFSRNEARYWRG